MLLISILLFLIESELTLFESVSLVTLDCNTLFFLIKQLCKLLLQDMLFWFRK